MFDTETTIAANSRLSTNSISNAKKNFFAMLDKLYVDGAIPMGLPNDIVEVDEALLGRKPTYAHGKINTIFKI